jgi:hypothetical protein
LAKKHHFNRLAANIDPETFMNMAIPLMLSATGHVGYSRSANQYDAPMSALPPYFSSMNAAWVSVDTESMRMEFHGGFDHFGFEIRKTEDSWILWRYTEKGRDILTERTLRSGIDGEPAARPYGSPAAGSPSGQP